MKVFSNHKPIVAILLIFFVSLSFRLYGLNWDQGQHLHPDERFLTMVTNDISLPTSLAQYFNTSLSPLNPYNYAQYQFFVYGTFPLFLTKFIAVNFKFDNYQHLVFVGRFLSALFDSLNIFLLYLLSRKLTKNKFVYFPSLLYTFCVLPLQLSHFFAVDTFLTTFILATFTLLVYNIFPLAAVTFGLALACKISAIYFLPIIILFLLQKYQKNKNIFFLLLITTFCLLITFLVFHIFQPYAFNGLFRINPHFIDSIKTLQLYSRPDGNFPPAVQWLSKTPLLFSLQNIVFWGLGLPIFIVFVISLFKTKFLKVSPFINFALIWLLLIYFYQGSQFAHSMRYFLPIYPFICLLVGIYLSKIKPKVGFIFLIIQIFIAIGFISIYSRPHSRVQASSWIYQNIPINSVLASEYWDDGLPLNLGGNNSNLYKQITLYPYDPDSSEKIETLLSQTNSADYLIMSSNRLWASIPQVPKLYPLTTKYYQDLFAEKLNFKKLIEINSYPGFTLPFLNKCYYFGPTNFPGIKNQWFTADDQCLYPGIYLRDDTAEEAFSVYDHPKVLIFQKQK